MNIVAATAAALSAETSADRPAAANRVATADGRAAVEGSITGDGANAAAAAGQSALHLLANAGTTPGSEGQTPCRRFAPPEDPSTGGRSQHAYGILPPLPLMATAVVATAAVVHIKVQLSQCLLERGAGGRMLGPARPRQGREIAGSILGNRRPFSGVDGQHQFVHCGDSLPRNLARQNLPQHDAETVHVTLEARNLPVENLKGGRGAGVGDTVC